jgi:DNA-directed RNA polymerase specialized sigma24 family protein
VTKQDLRQYRHLVAEIEQLKAERETLRSKTGSAPDGQPRGTEPGDVTAEAAIRCEKISRMITERIEESTALLVRIEAAINNLPDARERRLMRLKYIDGLKWAQVADVMGYEIRQVTRIHGWALANMAKRDH